MDTSLIQYLNETAQSMLKEAETCFPALAEDLCMEAAAMMNLAAKIAAARAEAPAERLAKAA